MTDSLPMTPENIDRLVDAMSSHGVPGYVLVGNGRSVDEATLALALKAAAARLTAPPVEPRWPENAFAYFDKTSGQFRGANTSDIGLYVRDAIPCRVLPADAVVLTAEMLPKVIGLLEIADRIAPSFSGYGYDLGAMLADLRALRKEAAP